MAVLNGSFPGYQRILAAQAAALPQPDQLCGPFAAYAALHAVLDSPPDLLEIAAAAGTAIWPHDVVGWRPAGAPLDRTGWGRLPRADSPESSGTDAAGLARALADLTPTVEVVPVSCTGATTAGLARLLTGLRDLADPVGVVANLRTGPLGLGSGGPAWDVGHFVVLWAFHEPPGQEGAGRVAIADSYPELGDPGEPAGCRWVPLPALTAAVSVPPGRGLLLVTRAGGTGGVRLLASACGLESRLWST